MKKLLSAMVALVLLFGMCPVGFAMDVATQDLRRVYEEYEKIIAEANDLYGCELFLLPFDEMEEFCSVEEFRARVVTYCENKNAPLVQTVGTVSGNVSCRGVGVVTIPNVKTVNYMIDRITITFYGTFDVRVNLNGQYYVYSHSHTVYTGSANGVVYYAAQGNPTTKVVDGGRTIMVTQQFSIYISGQFGENKSVTAGYTVNLANGNITAN